MIERKSREQVFAIWPDTWLPTCTVMTALEIAGVAETAAVRGSAPRRGLPSGIWDAAAALGVEVAPHCTPHQQGRDDDEGNDALHQLD
jgi:hypothetical protein